MWVAEDGGEPPSSRSPADRDVLTLPTRSLVVVAGIPGAGKSTLLHRLYPGGRRHPVVVCDPERIRVRWERLLRGRRGYRLWRPVVYLEHYTRLLVALLGRRPVVLHDTATRRWARRGLARAARLTGRTPHLLWLDVSYAESVDGQQRRGRFVPRASLARHWRRASRLRVKLEARRRTGGFASTILLNRARAGHVSLRFVLPLPRQRPAGKLIRARTPRAGAATPR
jgi:predicted kinase